MTDDQDPWYSDPSDGPTPPSVPDGGPPPGSGPQQYPHPSPQQPYPQQYPHPYPQQPYPQQPPVGYQPFGQPGYGPVATTSGKATASMVVGIVGLASIVFCYGVLGIVLGPVAYFMGRSAEKEMALAPNAWSNKGMARAGWIMGLIQIIIAIVVVLAVGALIIWAASADGSDF